jgi:hypothetical protein
MYSCLSSQRLNQSNTNNWFFLNLEISHKFNLGKWLRAKDHPWAHCFRKPRIRSSNIGSQMFMAERSYQASRLILSVRTARLKKFCSKSEVAG